MSGVIVKLDDYRPKIDIDWLDFDEWLPTGRADRIAYWRQMLDARPWKHFWLMRHRWLVAHQ